MKIVTHTEQQKAWEKEHAEPEALLQMDQNEASSGVKKFFDFLIQKNFPQKLTGLEMGCGKGRNVIWLASKAEIKKVYGFDFSSTAIAEAKIRAKSIELKTDFQVADATEPWSYGKNMFDFAVDCFASTDIESLKGRVFAAKEFFRVLKPGAHLFVYALSTDDEFHKIMAEKSPTNENGAFVNSLGKFEKSFTEDELIELYQDLKLVKKERISKNVTFYGEQYKCYHHWLVFKKR